MKISALIKKLEKLQDKYGNIDVMYQDGDGDSIWPVEHLQFHEAEEDEYPEDWNMKAGYKFIMVGN